MCCCVPLPKVTIDDKFFRHSFIYPDLSSEPEALQQFIATDLIETAHKLALEKAGTLWVTGGWGKGVGQGEGLAEVWSRRDWGGEGRGVGGREALQQFIATDLIETAHKLALEKAGTLWVTGGWGKGVGL